MNPILRFIIDVLKPVKFWIIGQSTIALIWAFDMSFRPYLLKCIIDALVDLKQHSGYSSLIHPAIGYIAMSFFAIITFRLYDFILLSMNPIMKRYIGEALIERVLEQSPSFFHNRFAGNIGNKIKEVMISIPDLLRMTIDTFFSNFLAIVVAFITAWSVGYKFSCALLTWVLLSVFHSIRRAEKVRSLSANHAEMRSETVGRIVDIINNMTSIRLFATQDHERKKLRETLDQYGAAYQKLDWSLLEISAFQGFSFVAYQALCIIWLMYDFNNGYVTAGDFALILSVNTALFDWLWSLSEKINKAIDTFGMITQGLNLLPPLDKITLPSTKNPPLLVTAGEIIFNQVDFHYAGKYPLFQKKSVRIAPGEKVGLVGRSGSGKSTFVHLILRLYDITHGTITIDGQDIKSVTCDSLNRMIGMVPQDPILFHRSLLENIRYGNVTAPDEAVFEAAVRAHAHEFITKLPNQYNSIVGERGTSLSGGQRQRIAIARAILKDAPILILDEATSQLDSETERKIQDSLWQLMKGKTTIVIAHQLSTLLHMDRILVFENGTIVEDGPHEILASQGGLYQQLWEANIDRSFHNKKSEKTCIFLHES